MNRRNETESAVFKLRFSRFLKDPFSRLLLGEIQHYFIKIVFTENGLFSMAEM